VKVVVNDSQERVDKIKKEKSALTSVLTKRERETLGASLLGLVSRNGGGPPTDQQIRMYLRAW
jgi:hypothetical protein